MRWGKELRSVLGSEACCFGFELHLGSFIQLWRRRCAGGYRDADFLEKVLLTGWRACAEQPYRVCGRVVELVRGVRGNVDGLSGLYDLFLPAEGSVEFAFEDGEGLFEIVAMGRGAAAGGNMHVDETEAAGGVFA